MQIPYIRLLVRDFRGCLRFYRDVVGLAVREAFEEFGYAELHGGDMTLALADVTMMDSATPGFLRKGDSADAFAIGLRVQDLEKAHQDLTAKGVIFLMPPTSRPEWGIRLAYFRDPNGNLVEMYQNIGNEGVS